MPNINVLIKPASGMCNLQCNYCFYHNETKKREIESYGFMSEETLEKVIQKRWIIQITCVLLLIRAGNLFCAGLTFFRNQLSCKKSIM